MIFRVLVAFGVTAAGTWAVARVARRAGLVDHPGPRKPHPVPVPLAGGLAVAVGITAGLAGVGHAAALLIPGWALALVGVVDDARDLRARTRLAAQAVAALPVALAYAPAIGVPRPVEVGLSLLFVLAGINAMKCIDSADGVAAGVAVAGAISLGSLGGWDGAAGTTAAVVAGAAAGFLVFNAPPARCFLGEGGGTLLVLLLASVALAMAGAAPPDRSVEVAVAAGTILSVPILDFALVHVRRARAGVRRLADLMASAGTDHLPHRLGDAGLGPWGVAAACAAAVAASGLVAHLSLRWGAFGVLVGAIGAVGVFLGAELSPVMRGTRFHPQRYRPTGRPVEARGRSIPVRDPPAIKEA